jgi:hypothetical protein
MSTTKNRPRYHVCVKGGTEEKPVWVRIGSAFENKNGGHIIRLNAAPITGEMWLFPPKPDDAPAEA